MKITLYILLSLAGYSESILAIEINEITESISDICYQPSDGLSKHYEVVVKGDADFRVKFLGKLGGEAEFNKEEWEGVERILQKDVATDRKDYRECVKELTPIFIQKFASKESTFKLGEKNTPNLFENPYSVDEKEFNTVRKSYKTTSIKLRHGHVYTFSTKFKNSTPSDIGLNNVHTSFSEGEGDEGGDYNGSENPTFPWTKEMIEKKYIINPNKEITIVESDKDYPIIYHPKKRASDNLFVIYKILYYSKKHSKWNKKLNVDIHAQSYEITWCGDGIIDNYMDVQGFQVEEECDPNDPQEENWGEKGCMKKLCQSIH